MKKRVIMVGGTAFSGSTMLNLMLGNGDNAFACGEPHALFRPKDHHHYNPVCGCGDTGCDIWKPLKGYGEKGFYRGVFQEMPEVDMVVDGSKSTPWYRDQLRYQQGNPDLEIIHVLIWKTPLEFAYSAWKRNKFSTWLSKGWRHIWISYHRRYFSIAKPSFYSVRYRDLAQAPAVKLKSLCEKIGIDYWPGKEDFWKCPHHSLFGSDTANLHLHNKGSARYSEIAGARSGYKPNVQIGKEPEFKYYRQIRYDDTFMERIPVEIQQSFAEEEELDCIVRVLEAVEIDNPTPEPDLDLLIRQLQTRPISLQLEKGRRSLSSWVNRLDNDKRLKRLIRAVLRKLGIEFH